MNPRTTGILFLVTAALAAFVYFYEIRGEEGRREAERAEKLLFHGIRAADISWISLRTSDDQDARLERADGGWKLTAPLQFPADGVTADAMASSLADLSSEAVYAKPQPLEAYGLGEDARSIHFGAGGAEHVLRLGNKTPVGSDTYAQVKGDAAVYAVATHTTNTLTKKLDDVRDKRVAVFDRAAIDRITLSWPHGGVVLRRDGEKWRLLQPVDGPADPETVDDLLTDLSFLRATSFVDNPPSDAKVRLDPPALAVTLEGHTENESEPPVAVRVEIGDVVGGTSRMVRGAQPSLYVIPQERLHDFPREVIAYRFKQLAKFPVLDARRVELAFQPVGGEPVTVTATRTDEGWSASPEDFRPGRLASMVSDLSRLRASGILADSMTNEQLERVGLAPPRTIIQVYGKGEADAPLLAEVQLGEAQGSSGIAARAEGNDSVFLLGPELTKQIPVSLKAFRKDFASEAAKPAAADAGAAAPAAAPNG